MMSLDLLFRFIAIACFGIWRIYWQISEWETEKQKPKNNQSRTIGLRVTFLSNLIIGIFVILQLLGLLVMFPFSQTSLFIEGFGSLFVMVGIAVSIIARVQLGNNWEHGALYQVKKHQELVTHGIYAYIRHPIYAGLSLALVGAELVAQSYLFLLAIVSLYWLGYVQAKKEEALLEKHFGESYAVYMKKTKMFIPFLF